jgi:predicted DNA-binding transcriptional regulator YafY
MSQTEHRYDRLAVRLSLIISRLLAGETLSVKTLAVEFGVSVRTLRRDFRERLIYLNLEYRHGHCRLLSDPGMAQRAREPCALCAMLGFSRCFQKRTFAW